MESNLLRNNQNEIICKEHNFIAHSICLDKNCENQIICQFCKCSHEIKKNSQISFIHLFNKNFVNNIFDEKFFNEENKINQIINLIKKSKDEICLQFDRIEKILIQNFKENCKELKYIDFKKDLRKKNLKLQKHNNNFLNLKEYAEEIKNFFDFETEKKFFNSDNIIDSISKKLEDIKVEINNIINEKIKSKNIIFELDKNLFKNPFDKQINLKNIKPTPKKYKLNEKTIIKKTNFINTEIFFNHSNLIKDNTDKNFIINLFEKTLKSTKILYKGQIGNLNDFYFYKNSVDKGNLFFIAKSNEKKIFGGFIPNGLKSSKKHGEYYKEKNSFLFSLDHKQKLKCINENYSLKHYKNDFSTFCIHPSCDLYI